MIKFPHKNPRLKKLEEVNSVLLHCIVALMKIDDEPRIKELQLLINSVKKTYESSLKNEIENDKLERFSKKNST